MKSVLNFFRSVNLAITLLIIIIIASILGTLIPQQRSSEEYLTRYGQMANLFIRLQLTKLYHSFWYITLLSLFALNIIVCTLDRIWPKFKKAFKPILATDTKSILALKIKSSFKKSAALPQVKDQICQELGFRRYRLRKEEKGRKIFILARKKILGLLGAEVVHFGILIILAGGISSGLGGLRKDLVFHEGEVLSLPQANFLLRLDKFETEYYPNGSVKDWKSTLTVIENNTPRLTKAIEVNHPLSYRGFVFYQSSYGWDWEESTFEIWAKKKSDPSFLKKIELRVGQRAALEEDKMEISLVHFVPDFVLNEKNEVTSRSLEPNNPAAFIEGWKGEEKIFSGWIFSKFPDFSRIHSARESELSFELKNIDPKQYSVLQVAKDPGVNLIWLGSTFLMIGLFLAFYWPIKEIRIIIEESDGKVEVIAGGISSKGREAFESEFENIMSSMRSKK